MKSKKIILILLSIVLVFSGLKAKKIKRYFDQERYQGTLVKLGIIHKCYTPYPDDLESIFAQEEMNYEQLDQAITLSSLKKLKDKDIKPAETSKIPTITHHIYFTSPSNPVKLPDFYIEKIKANFSRLNEVSSNWQHYIWTNNASIFPAEIKNIKGVTIKEIEEFREHALYNYISKIINKGEKMRAYYMEASDMLRLMALQRFGGIYNDMDYEIYNASSLFELMKKFDFIGGREFPRMRSFYGNAFMVAKASHPVINEAVRRLELYHSDPNSANIPDYIKYTCGLFEKLYLNSPPLLTISYFKKNNIEGNNDIILPFWMVFNANFAHLKNGECEYSKFNKEDFYDTDKLSNLMKEFSIKPTAKYFNLGEEEVHPRQDIYYNIEDRKGFDIIGADMFCGTWSRNIKSPKFYYFNWPFNKILKSDEN